jgi:serine/threonine protein kinase
MTEPESLVSVLWDGESSIEAIVADSDLPEWPDSTWVSRPAPPPLPRRSSPPPPEAPRSSRRTALATGCVLAGRYRLERNVGHGGMGEVWSAEHVTIHMRVAVKVLLPSARRVPEIVARFEREAILLGRMRGDHVPRVIDFLTDELHGPVLVTEFVEGASLADVLKAPVSVERAVDLGIDVARALGELHRGGVVHRDMKPGNVILRPNVGGGTSAVVIDLGVSRLVRDDDTDEDIVADITTGDAVVGTLEYMAPEQILSCGDVTAAADLYALGALLFRAVTGGYVFGPHPDRMELVRTKLTTVAPPLPTGRRDPVARGLATVLARALERSPAARYHSADQLLADLMCLRDLVTCKAVPPSTAVGPRARTLSGRLFAAAAIVALLLSVAWAQIAQPASGAEAASPAAAPSLE